MNEVQGPTPTGTSRPYKSLAEALRGQRIDPVNHDFIRAIVEAVGISTFIDRGRYIEAIRRGEGAALHIGRTYTNGFGEDEQVVVAGRVLPLAPSEGRAPYFYVTHPSELQGAPAGVARPSRAAGTRAPGTRAAAKPKPEPRAPKATPLAERDYGICDVCFMVKTPSGGCGCD
ncbi:MULTISPECIES: hypothetical protein [unclassified Microbacterium]|uniref:hypothetical protein n=1 Tax=unclassified Microbacterium TaxID=2609290 RepID=UPI001DCEA65C|nr:hypothetical protein [Microbacterium sp. USTB-Y]MBS1898016.1 hypothetical protein [Actinomycetota bacterium]